jgi:hypothetical protein
MKYDVAAELGVGVDVALVLTVRDEMNGIVSVEFRGLLEAGHATQRRCYPALRPCTTVEAAAERGTWWVS